ncbi:transcription factor Sfp1p [Monosporozyma servazzii]
MDFTSTLTPNKNITNNSPPSPSSSSTTTNTAAAAAQNNTNTPAIFISHSNNNSMNSAKPNKQASIALSVSPTSTPPSGNVDLNKLRRDSLAHSQGMGGISWGSVTIGSWLRDEVMLRGANNTTNNNNTTTTTTTAAAIPNNNADTASNYISNTKMYNANRNSISYRRLSTINNMNNKAMKLDNNSNSNVSLNLLPQQPSVTHLNSPPFNTSTYLPNLEKQFCKDYSCCGLSLPGLHDLLRHYEEAHIGGNAISSSTSATSASNNANPSTNAGNSIKKPTLSKQQYTKQHKHIIQQQLKSTNDNSTPNNSSLKTFNNSMVSNNKPSHHQLYNNNNTSTTSIPKNNKSSLNNLNNYTFNNKSKDAIIRNNENDNDNSTNPTSKKTNNNGSMMSSGIDLDFMDDDIMNIGLKNSNNNNNNNNSSNNNNINSTNGNNSGVKGQGGSQGLRNSSIPSAIMANDPLSTTNHLNMNHGMVDIDEDEDDDDDDDDDDDEDEDDDEDDDADDDNGADHHGNRNDQDDVINNNNNNSNQNNNNDLKNQLNSLDMSTNNNNLHSILMGNSDINNLLRDSFSMPTMNFNNDNTQNNNSLNMNNNNDNNNNNNNHNNNSNNSNTTNTQTTNSQTINLNPTANLNNNNNNNRPNFIDDPARRLYVMDHEEHKPFKCPVIGCEKTYKNQNGLKYHRIHGHQNQKLLENSDGTFTILDPDSNEPYPEGMGYEKDKPYRCEVCGKRYKNLNGLKYHRGHSTH